MARPALHDRDATLDRALGLFWRRGFHATSMKDLEQALDMRPGSIYAAFGSKDALYRAALARYGAGMRAQLAEALAGAPDPLAGLAQFMRVLGVVGDGPDAPRACMLARAVVELNPDQAEALAEAEAMVAAVENDMAAAFTEAAAQGILPPGSDPALLAACLQAEAMGLRAYAERRAAPIPLAALAEALAQRVEAMRA